MGNENKNNVDVLMLTVSYGGGHVQAANALTLGLQALQPKLAVEILDYVRWLNATLDYLTRLAYVKVTSKVPTLWHLLYDFTDRPFFAKYSLTRRLGFQRLYNYILYKQPKLIVSTHFLTTAVVGEMKKLGLIDVPLATVITDNILHALWLNPAVDLYLVANGRLRASLMQHGIAQHKIMVTGIPIDVKFNRQYAKRPLRHKLGLDPDLPTILVMSGAYGMGDIKGICRYLANYEQKIQVIVVAGKDEKLRRKISMLTKGAKNTFHIFGYVTNVFELMALADLLISKAGGLTTSEALASELPMLIYRPIPGQEEGNAEYLLNAGAAEVANNMEQFATVFKNIMMQPGKLESMAYACAQVKKPLAALQGGQLLLSLLGNI